MRLALKAEGSEGGVAMRIAGAKHSRQMEQQTQGDMYASMPPNSE